MGLVERIGKLQSAFASVGFIAGGEFYVPASAAMAYLEACRRASLAVAGVEVFTLLGTNLRPRLDLIADYSNLVEAAGGWSSIVDKTIEEARSFAEHQVGVHSDLWLNFTLLSEQERSYNS